MHVQLFALLSNSCIVPHSLNFGVFKWLRIAATPGAHKIFCYGRVEVNSQVLVLEVTLLRCFLKLSTIIIN